MQDTGYKEFHSRLIPTIEPERVIGVRTPQLRQYARQISGTALADEFLISLPHHYYEENNLHAFLIERIKDYDRCIDAVESFLPYVDNWATCDSMSPKVFAGHLPDLLSRIEKWLASGETYTIRFGTGMLMKHYLGDEFKPEYARMVADVASGEYYVNMMRAWYFATALAKQYDCAVVYLEQGLLDRFTHEHTIQKAIESYRIDRDTKEYLRSLRHEKSS